MLRPFILWNLADFMEVELHVVQYIPYDCIIPFCRDNEKTCSQHSEYGRVDLFWKMYLFKIQTLERGDMNLKGCTFTFLTVLLFLAYFIKRTRSQTQNFHKTTSWAFRKSGSSVRIHCIAQKLIFEKFEDADFKYGNRFFKTAV